MSEADVIECKPTRWFYLRALAMVTMFAVFCGLFMKDWKIGWPKKNEVYYTFEAFKKAKEEFQSHEEAERGAEAWNQFASEQLIGFPTGEGLLPSGVDSQATWPKVLIDYASYKKAFEEEGNKATPPQWATYTDERGWSSSTPEKSYDQGKIAEQLYFGIGSGVLMLVGLFFLVRTSRRSMKVDGEAFHAPNGTRIPYSALRRIDKRKWETKGLAYLFYDLGEGQRKTKLDGMVYGQFKAEEGAPAEKFFRRILENFSGELVELEDDEEEEDEPPADPSTPANSEGDGEGPDEGAENSAGKEKGD